MFERPLKGQSMKRPPKGPHGPLSRKKTIWAEGPGEPYKSLLYRGHVKASGVLRGLKALYRWLQTMLTYDLHVSPELLKTCEFSAKGCHKSNLDLWLGSSSHSQDLACLKGFQNALWSQIVRQNCSWLTCYQRPLRGPSGPCKALT